MKSRREEMGEANWNKTWRDIEEYFTKVDDAPEEDLYFQFECQQSPTPVTENRVEWKRISQEMIHSWDG